MENIIYIPDKIREVNPGLSAEELNDYIDRVWYLLEKMNPGQTIIINEIATKHPDLFRECVKDYMDNHEYQDGLTFTRNFVSVQKVDIDFIRGSEQKNKTKR